MGHIEDLSKICTEVTMKVEKLNNCKCVISKLPNVRCRMFPSFNLLNYYYSRISGKMYVVLSYKGFAYICDFYISNDQILSLEIDNQIDTNVNVFDVFAKMVQNAFVDSCLSNFRNLFLKSQAKIIYGSWSIAKDTYEYLSDFDKINISQNQVFEYLIEKHPEEFECIISILYKRNKRIAINSLEAMFNTSVKLGRADVTANILEIKRNLGLQNDDEKLTL